MGCYQQKDDLMEISTALDTLLRQVPSNVNIISKNLDDALGKVLAVDICSTIDVPGFDNSSMDGYALNLQDTAQLNSKFIITGVIKAGSHGEELTPNTCARIFTGAPVPSGANAVIMQEQCELSADKKSIIIKHLVSHGENIRLAGNDIKQNSVILSKGTVLRPQDIALAASVGVAKIDVFAAIKVGVFFTGDELVEPGEKLEADKIYNSNRYALVALLKNLGCEVLNLGNIKDNFDTTCAALNKLQGSCDFIITTGGVSVGDEDHIRPAVEKLGKLTLWRLKIKPGKPLAFGKVNNTAFMGLPGNPVSAMVTFMLFAKPFINKMQGMSNIKPTSFGVVANFDWMRKKYRTEFVRVRLDYTTTPPNATLYSKQGSDVLSSIVWADGLVEIAHNTTFKKGEIVQFFALNQLIT